VYEKTSLGPTTRICSSVHTPLTTHLGRQSLEERSHAFRLDHLPDDGHTADLRVEVGILNTRLDNVERSGDGDGRDGSCYTGDEVWGISYTLTASFKNADSLCDQVAVE
jgi:hypothetical protein